MKKFLKSAGLPIGVFALAIGSAFATNAVKNAQTIVPGYQKMDNDGLVCRERTMCDTQGDIACTWIEGSTEHLLYGKQGPIENTVCTLPLFKVEE
ncbi:hypothetical protein HX045_15450 [Myroides odoratimimus]|uniref:DUF6520 family protein n=1 Tax=Myroides odoratimimus TaxID=76832 RepID=UPI0025783E57|nr:DUF6520 family protein [Myroides odoratimimus]MDM1039118.1 hypothetical protein [Myroides odoratimimus]MDM1053305.1 hypothetical protein [Myroides odoratimimus]MDM1454892.1 hypothetical protein [Myroides odoratimimus]MDM1465235.1 hypothetical protein [Myroides odoratimimus]MDM1475221.1 hypothetical protein [Myroides odoratimimus]